ncbi:MAG TPA: NAD(P)/FAD-dependent oxidoreductase [Bacilli bacterium]|nr:NAD(P)/FAD-dependent oxidoreductase [Bacilli bacterium]
MRIAIIGAGLSGLACAHRLEQLGFDGQVDIFEERQDIGTGNVFLEYAGELFYRPVADIFAHYAEHYKLYLRPLQTIYKSLTYGPTRMSHLHGFQGHIVARGSHPHALERQLYEQIRTKVQFNRRVDVEAIRGEYDVVVLATGNLADVPKSVRVRVDRDTSFYHAMIRGAHDPQLVKLWWNRNYAPEGYAYLLPLDEHRAMISIVTPQGDKLPDLWRRFRQEVLTDRVEIESMQQVNHLPIGQPERLRDGNVIFAGNAVGAITPAMGFGLHMAILTGMYIGEEIVEGRDYEERMQQHLQEYRWSLSVRNRLELMNDSQLDAMVDGMDSFIGRHLLRSGGVNFLRYAGRMLGLIQDDMEKSTYPTHLLPYDGETIMDKRQEQQQPPQQ